MICALLLLSACNPTPETPAGNETTPAAPSSLEQAAQESGLLETGAGESPIGLYRNRHEAGLDSLCIVEGKDGELEFGLSAAFGEGISCAGKGTLRQSGDKLIMNFARSACLAVASFDGDSIAFPGAMDVDCEALCTARGSLEGVSIPRVSRDEGVARDARDEGRRLLCP